MELKVRFDMDNDAFAECYREEAARILHRIAGLVLEGHQEGLTCDFNGNVVGSYEVCEDDLGWIDHERTADGCACGAPDCPGVAA